MKHTKKILFTRSRWDRLFSFAVIAAFIAAGFCVYSTGQHQHWLTPVGLIGLWMYFRYRTPREGTPSVSIEGNPAIIRLLAFLGGCLMAVLAFFLFDHFVMGQPINAPLRWYHGVFGIAIFSVIVCGSYVIDRNSRSPSDPFGSTEHELDSKR